MQCGARKGCCEEEKKERKERERREKGERKERGEKNIKGERREREREREREVLQQRRVESLEQLTRNIRMEDRKWFPEIYFRFFWFSAGSTTPIGQMKRRSRWGGAALSSALLLRKAQ